MTWWATATDDQKTSQIKSGIQLGMTFRQIALASDCPKWVVKDFAQKMGLKSPVRNTAAATNKIVGSIKKARADYFRGGEIRKSPDESELWEVFE